MRDAWYAKADCFTGEGRLDLRDHLGTGQLPAAKRVHSIEVKCSGARPFFARVIRALDSGGVVCTPIDIAKTTKTLIRDFTTTPLPIPKIFLVVYLLKLSSECLVSYDPHFPGNDGTKKD